MTGDIDFNDTVKARFGNGNDLEIFHDGLESKIWDNGVGGLVLQTGGSPIELRAINQPDNEIMLKATPGGSIDLYEDGDKKFETTSTGVQVTGRIDILGTGTRIDIADNGKIILGDGNDLQIHHDGSHSFIQDGGTGKLLIRTSQLQLEDDVNEPFIYCIKDGAVSLYYDSSKK